MSQRRYTRGCKNLERSVIINSKSFWNIPGWDAIESWLSVWIVHLKIWVGQKFFLYPIKASNKTTVVSSAKFTILISWSHISISLILLLALKKLASTSATIMYKSTENRYPWQTSRIRVKGSDRRHFWIHLLNWNS